MSLELRKYALVALQCAKTEEYDIVHAHDWMTFTACDLIGQETETPCVAHIHSTEWDRSGAYADSEIIKIEKQGIHNASHVIAVSEHVKAQICGDHPDKVSVVPNGMNPIKSSKRQKQNKKTIGFLGRFADQKGPGKFLDIARDIISQRQDVHFTMIGDGYLMEMVRNKITHLNLTGHVDLKGFLSHDEALKQIQSFDLMIVPSNAEPFGLVILEAVMSGVPVITTPGVGISEFIPALLTEYHWDVFSFVRTVNRLLDDEKFAETYVKACREQGAQLTWHNSAQATQKIYQSIT
jgi:glycosyltransferase involved in cell wall biosynthesis